MTITRRDFLRSTPLAGVAGLLLRRAGKPAPKPLVIAGQVLYLQGVALDSLRRYLRRDISPRWSKPPR